MNHPFGGTLNDYGNHQLDFHLKTQASLRHVAACIDANEMLSTSSPVHWTVLILSAWNSLLYGCIDDPKGIARDMPQCPNQVNITCLFFEKQQTNLRTISNSSTVDKKSAISLCLLPIIDPSTGHVKQPKKARNAPISSLLSDQPWRPRSQSAGWIPKPGRLVGSQSLDMSWHALTCLDMSPKPWVCKMAV